MKKISIILSILYIVLQVLQADTVFFKDGKKIENVYTRVEGKDVVIVPPKGIETATPKDGIESIERSPITSMPCDVFKSFSQYDDFRVRVSSTFPDNVAVDHNGNVFVVERIVRRLSKDKKATEDLAISEDGMGVNASFYNPYAITVDSNGNIFVTDGSKVRKITSEGVVTTLAGSGIEGSDDGMGIKASFYDPKGIAVDNNGYIFVATSRGIRKITSKGVVTTIDNSGGEGIAVDSSGNVLVANGSEIRKITSEGKKVSTLNFSDPDSLDNIVFDNNGHIFAVETHNHKIIKIISNDSVTLLAGSGIKGSEDGIRDKASFNYPHSIAVDNSGNVFVADSGNHKIRKITSTGVVTTLAGSDSRGSNDGNGDKASFDYPTGVAVDKNGNVFVADSWNNKIRKITPAGVVTTLVGSDEALLGVGTTIDQNGTIFVADSRNHKIKKITPDGIVTSLAGSGIEGSKDGIGDKASFNYPKGVAVDGKGKGFFSSGESENIYVADSRNHKIRKITPAGVVTTLAGSGFDGSKDGVGIKASFKYPEGVAVDSEKGSIFSPRESGNIYVADSGNHKIRKITPAGVVTTLAGSGIEGSKDGIGIKASFNYPHSIVVDNNGDIYVAESRSHKIRKITSKGIVSTLAVPLGTPEAVAVDSDGTIYVADSWSGSIKKIVCK